MMQNLAVPRPGAEQSRTFTFHFTWPGITISSLSASKSSTAPLAFERRKEL